MSLLVVGLSHRSAGLSLLERTALDGTGARELAAAACATGAVQEALVLATCNRLELYAEVDSFHPALAAVTAAVSATTGVPAAELEGALQFSHGDAVVERLFTVTAGLDSMALGESQIMGQVRLALRRGQEDATVGRVLDPLVQHALRTGKRVHGETGLDLVARSLVEEGVADAPALVGVPDWSGVRALVIGAGAMSGLAAAVLHRRGPASIVVANRTPERAARLAESVGGTAVALGDAGALAAALAEADVVVSCTGAVGHVLDVDLVRAVRARRDRPQLLVDLALPRDVDPAVAALPGAHLVDLAQLHRRLAGAEEGAGVEVAAARAIVAEEVAAASGSRRVAAVAPVVTALRAQARGVVDGELDRLRARLAGADPRVMAEVELAVHRVVEKLLHTPSVRVKALAAGGEGGESYADALRELFALHQGGPGEDAGGSDAGTRASAATASGPVQAAGAPTAVRASGSVADVLHAVGEGR